MSLLPLSHLFEQAVALYYALDVGADVLYVRSRNPRVIFEAIRDHRTTSMVVVPQVLDLFWSGDRARGREVGPGGDVRPPSRHRPAPAVRAAPAPVPARPRAARRRAPASSSAPARSCRRRSSRRGRTSASSSSRATARPRPGSGRARRARTTASGRSGGRCRRSSCGSPTTARSSSAARRSSRATGTTPRRPRRRSPRTAGTGRATSAGSTTPGRLVLMGRTKDIIVLPNGLNVYPGGHRERAPDRRPPRLGASSRRSPGGSRPSCCRRAGVGRDRRRRPIRESIQAGGQGGERDARPAPAGRRLPGLAGGRLPADAHAQGQARRGPSLGRGRRAAAGPRRRGVIDAPIPAIETDRLCFATGATRTLSRSPQLNADPRVSGALPAAGADVARRATAWSTGSSIAGPRTASGCGRSSGATTARSSASPGLAPLAFEAPFTPAVEVGWRLASTRGATATRPRPRAPRSDSGS